jgi:hypothetical protein
VVISEPHVVIDEAKHRKDRPIFRGLLSYFPDACLEVAHVSKVGNEQHNPGQPMHWAYGKSMDHADCIGRHQLDYRRRDKDGVRHAAKVAWRALAQLQTLLEEENPELHAERTRDRADQAAGKV